MTDNIKRNKNHVRHLDLCMNELVDQYFAVLLLYHSKRYVDHFLILCNKRLYNYYSVALKSDCADVQADLELHCSHTTHHEARVFFLFCGMRHNYVQFDVTHMETRIGKLVLSSKQRNEGTCSLPQDHHY